MKTSSLLAIGFFLSFYPPLDPILKKLLRQLTEFRQSTPIEKVYLHTDKTVYTLNETLWFKAYLVEGIEHQKDTISKIVYVDLLKNNDNSLVSRKILNIENSQCNGQLELTTDLKEGDYTLRAYTNWMKNFDSHYFFYMPIKIIHNTPVSINKNADTPNLSALFFPESGQLLEGINNRIGIRVFDKNNKKGVSAKVQIFENGQPSQIIETEQDGITAFNLLIKPNNQYSAKIIGQNDDFLLPSAAKSGYGLHIDNYSQVFFKTRIYLSVPEKEKPSKLFIIGHLRGKPCYATTIDITDKTLKELEINIPKKNFLQEGVATITIFNQDGLPLAERLAYVDFVSSKINLKVDVKGENKARGKITLEIEAKNANDEAIEGSFSLAALAAVSDQKYWQDLDLYTYMLLGSDLNGALPNISAHFLKDKKQHIDDVLITQGWTKFEWYKTKTINHSVVQNLNLIGSINDKSKKPVANESILLSVKDANQNTQSQYSLTNENGQFSIEGLNFMDSTKVYVRLINKKCNKCTFELEKEKDTLRMPYWSTIDNIPYQTLAYLENYHKQSEEKQVNLKEVNIKAKRSEPSEIKIDSRRMYKEAEMVFHIKQEDARNKKNIMEYLQGKNAINIYGLNPLSTAGDKNVNTTSTRGRTSFQGSNEVLFLVDGVPADVHTMLSLSITQIETIEVIKSARAGILFGARAANGMVNVLTRSYKNLPIDISNEDFEHSLVAETQGYSIVKTFYSPDYEKENISSRIDNRTTLFWQPHIQTDKNGKASVSFYNNDLETPIIIHVNGTDFKGNFGHLALKYGK